LRKNPGYCVNLALNEFEVDMLDEAAWQSAKDVVAEEVGVELSDVDSLKGKEDREESGQKHEEKRQANTLRK
jgi:hypothetical protein